MFSLSPEFVIRLISRLTFSDDVFRDRATCVFSSLLHPRPTKCLFSMQLLASDPDSAVRLPLKICPSVCNRFGVDVRPDY